MRIIQHLQKWGNGTGVRLSKKVVEAAGLAVNSPLEVKVHGRSVILTPVEEEEKPTLRSLLHGVTPERIAEEVEWGDDVGAEVYE